MRFHGRGLEGSFGRLYLVEAVGRKYFENGGLGFELCI
jgi:hypothetical protein